MHGMENPCIKSISNFRLNYQSSLYLKLKIISKRCHYSRFSSACIIFVVLISHYHMYISQCGFSMDLDCKFDYIVTRETSTGWDWLRVSRKLIRCGWCQEVKVTSVHVWPWESCDCSFFLHSAILGVLIYALRYTLLWVCV